MLPRFSISILTYRNTDLAVKCIESVLANRGEHEIEIIWTNNGNGPEASSAIRSRTLFNPAIVIVENDRNEGFIEPNRHALSIARGAWFIMLNDDAVVPERFLDLLEAPFLSDPRCALSSPNGGCCRIDEHMNGLPSHLPPEYLEGACLMGRTKQLRDFGLFAPELTHSYWEDVDLSLRFREAGWHLRFANFKLTHIRGATSSKVPDILSYQRKNAAYIHKRWGHYLRHRTFENPTIIRRQAAHGDVLLLTPVIGRLKEMRPCSPIWVETECWEVLSNNPKVAKFFPRIADAQVPANAVVYDLNMAYEKRTNVHIVDAYADVCGVKLEHRITEIYPTASDLAWAMRTIPGEDWVAIHPGPSTWKGKQWPVERFVQLAGILQGSGMKVVLVGSTDRTMVPCDLDLRGHTTVLQMAAVMRFCRMMIGLDSLPAHCSQAVGTPTVVLYGATSPQFIATDGAAQEAVCGTTPCAGERHRIADSTMTHCDGACMRSISAESVLNAIHKLTGSCLA